MNEMVGSLQIGSPATGDCVQENLRITIMDSGSVRVVESCLVTPSEETPTRGLWLSPLDLVLANRGHTPLVHFYSYGDAAAAAAAADFFNVVRLKESMAKALVAFYPFAGRLGVDSDGRTEINCNAEGALFVVAHSDHTFEDFSDPKPSPKLRRLFVPRIEPSSSIILAIQVTYLKCGGVVLGTAMHHVVIDASSAFHFFQTWASYCRDGETATIELPCHDRALLRARSPPVIHPDTISMFCRKLTLRESSSSGPVVTEVFTISKDQLSALKRLCGGASTFCSVSALVWQCACVARRLDPDFQTRISFPVNIRRRVRPPLPNCYFGNALVIVSTIGTVRDVVSEPLASVAGRVRGTTERFDDELLRSAIDYYEMAEMGGPPGRGNLPETELRMVSWFGMPVYEADFGWGKPRVMLRAESVRGGFVYLMSGHGDCSARVLMCMEAANLNEFQRLLYAKLMYSKM